MRESIIGVDLQRLLVVGLGVSPRMSIEKNRAQVHECPGRRRIQIDRFLIRRDDLLVGRARLL